MMGLMEKFLCLISVQTNQGDAEKQDAACMTHRRLFEVEQTTLSMLYRYDSIHRASLQVKLVTCLALDFRFPPFHSVSTNLHESRL